MQTSASVGKMLVQRQRRWTSISPALANILCFSRHIHGHIFWEIERQASPLGEDLI